MRGIRFYLGLASGILLTLFALQNLQSVHVRLIFWFIEMPVVAIIFSSALIGALWAWLWVAMSRLRARRATAADTGMAEDETTESPSSTHAAHE